MGEPIRRGVSGGQVQSTQGHCPRGSFDDHASKTNAERHRDRTDLPHVSTLNPIFEFTYCKVESVTSSTGISLRPYRLGRRQEGIDATRNRIVGAARDSLVAGQPLTLNGVAERAGVSRPTVYHHFNNRRGLLDAVIADAQDESVAAAITAAEHPDPITAVLGWLRAAVEFWTQEADMLLLAWRVSEADPELSGAFEDQERARLQRARTLARRLAETTVLRRAWTVEEAALFLWLLSGPHNLQQLRGTAPDPVRFVLDTASRSLLTPQGQEAALHSPNRPATL